MIFDLDEFEKNELPEYDLCIIGSGPSGMTVANELADSGLRICVLESGVMKTSKQGDLLRHVESQGIHIKEYSRERVVGGASTTWSGLSSPLDPIDMEPRDYLPLSGWPITRKALMPFYAAAAERYRFPSPDLCSGKGLEDVKNKGDLSFTWKVVEEKVFMAADDPQHFGREFIHIFDGEKVDLFVDATLIRLEADGLKDRVSQATVMTRGKRTFHLKARTFVVATGGIENARILLNSKDLCEQGLGNARDQVGRYLMNHPKNYYGIIHLRHPLKDLPYYLGCLYKGYAGYAGLRLNENRQRAGKLMNSYIRFEPLFPWSDSEGVEALVLLVKKCKFLLKGWKRGKEEQVVSLRDYSETGDDSELQNERKSFLEWALLPFKIVAHFPSVFMYLYFRLRSDAKPNIRRIRLRNFMEMEPRPENRVLLGDALDPYDQPVPLVQHSCSERDRRSLIDLHEALISEIDRNDLGRIETRLKEEADWPIVQDASHHMGTTRMGTDPETSVVNPDCRVHDVRNVFMAGGSVFPTSGCANPTYTMVALSIRLSDHLRTLLTDEAFPGETK